MIVLHRMMCSVHFRYQERGFSRQRAVYIAEKVVSLTWLVEKFGSSLSSSAWISIFQDRLIGSQRPWSLVDGRSRLGFMTQCILVTGCINSTMPVYLIEFMHGGFLPLVVLVVIIIDFYFESTTGVECRSVQGSTMTFTFVVNYGFAYIDINEILYCLCKKLMSNKQIKL